MSKISELEDKEEELQLELNKIRKQIYDIENTQIVPALKKKLIGKCFKYLNSYGGDSEKWWLYSKITGVTSRDFGGAESFQIDCHGKATHELNESYLIKSNENYIPIENDEYDGERKKFIDHILKETSN